MENPAEYHRKYGYPVHRVWPTYSRFYVKDKSQVQHLSFWQHFHPLRFTYLLSTYWMEANNDGATNIFLPHDKNYHFVEESKETILAFKPFHLAGKEIRLRLFE